MQSVLQMLAQYFQKFGAGFNTLASSFAVILLLACNQSAYGQNPCPTISASDLDSDRVVNVYSARKEALILPLLEKFAQAYEKYHGAEIEINLITGKADGLLKRIELEGNATRADLFITVDAGRLYRAKTAEILRPIPDSIAMKVPNHLRDYDDAESGTSSYWIGLSQRARPIFYSRKRAKATDLTTYEQLASPNSAGRLCIRSSENIYNQSLVASMISNMIKSPGKIESLKWLNDDSLRWAHKQFGVQPGKTNDPDILGKIIVLAWAKQLVENFARPPTGGDTDQIRAVAAGQCDFAVSNTYYFGRLMAKNKDIADEVGIIWPNQQDHGTHINVSGAGITAHAKHPGNAQCLLAYLLEPESQKWYAQINYEYPVVPNVPWSDVLTELGGFVADDLEMGDLGKFNSEAVKIMDLAGWR